VVQPAYGVPPDDEEAIRRETQRIKARQQLEQLAQKIGGPGTRVADPAKFTQFLATADQQHRAQGGQGLEPPSGFIGRVRGAVGDAFRRPEPPPDAGMLDRLLPGARQLSTPLLPEAVETRAPEAVRPAARVIRGLSSPLALVTLPIAGAKLAAASVAGSIAGAQTGRDLGGETGETILAIAGGFAPSGILGASRAAPAIGRGVVRAGDEVAFRAQGRQVAHAATEPPGVSPVGRPPQIEQLIRDGGGLRTEDFTLRAGANAPELPATQKRLEFLEAQALNDLDPNPNYSTPAALRQMATRLEQEGVAGLSDASAGISGSQLELAEQLLGKDLAGLPPRQVAQEMRAVSERQIKHAQDLMRRIEDVRLRAEEAAIQRGMVAAKTTITVPPPAALVARSAAPPRVPPVGAVPPSGQPPDDRVQVVVDKITQLLRAAPVARQVTAAERRAAIGRGAAIGRERAAGLDDPLQQSRAFISGQSGQVTSQARFDPLGLRVAGPEGAGELARLTPAQAAEALGVTADDFVSLHRRIAERFPDQFTAREGQSALIRLLTGNVPTERGQRLLQEVFGPELVAAVRGKRTLLQRGGEVAFDVAFLIPKAVRSSWDASAPLRQGVVFTLNPRRATLAAESFADMIRAGFKRDAQGFATDLYMDTVDPAKNRWAGELYASGAPKRLFLHDPRGAMALTDKEEFYASQLIEQIPSLGGDLRPLIGRGTAKQIAISAATLPIRAFGSGVRRSELMYGTYLNQLRNKVATRTLEQWERSGKPINAADVDALIDGVNVFTGRGNLGSFFEKAAPVLSATFWSPRLAVSRFQAMGLAIRGGTLDVAIRNTPGARARRELAKDMVAFVGTGATILGALKAFNVADVELDPRSTDFGKVRVGNTRFDFWGGFQSTARFVAQVTAAQTKVLSGPQAGRIRQGLPHVGARGKVVEGEPSAKREAITMRFIRSKLAPGLPSLFWNEFTGETFLGEGLNEPSGLIGTTTGPTVNVRTRETFEQFVPLLAVDVIEAIEAEGWDTAFATIGVGTFGVGVQTFGGGDGAVAAPAPVRLR